MDVEQTYDRIHKKRQVDEQLYAESRNYMNYVKSFQYEKYINARDSVLDICCGKGQDLNKFRHRDVEYYIGIDVSSKALAECERRLQNKKNAYPFYWTIKKMDLRYSWPDDIKVDVVTCQLGPQYFLETMVIFDAFVKNVSLSLKESGRFLCTFPNSEVIIKNQNQKGLAYSIESECPLTNDKEGQQYRYSQQGHLEGVPEFLLPFSFLERTCCAYNLQLVEVKEVSTFSLGKSWKCVRLEGEEGTRVIEANDSFTAALNDVRKGVALIEGAKIEFPTAVFIPELTIDSVVAVDADMGLQALESAVTHTQRKMKGFYPRSKTESQVVNLYTTAVFCKKISCD